MLTPASTSCKLIPGAVSSRGQAEQACRHVRADVWGNCRRVRWVHTPYPGQESQSGRGVGRTPRRYRKQLASSWSGSARRLRRHPPPLESPRRLHDHILIEIAAELACKRAVRQASFSPDACCKNVAVDAKGENGLNTVTAVRQLPRTCSARLTLAGAGSSAASGGSGGWRKSRFDLGLQPEATLSFSAVTKAADQANAPRTCGRPCTGRHRDARGSPPGSGRPWRRV